MKRKTVALLALTMVLGTVGCGATKDEGSEVITQAISTVEPSASDSVDVSVDTNSSEAESETVKSDTVAIDGIWQCVTISDEEKEYASLYYVKFTSSEINYGHMTDDGEFVLDYSDKITLFECVAPGFYTIQAENSNGNQYTYQTAEDDNTIMNYYGSWNEDEFADTYSASSSLMKMN